MRPARRGPPEVPGASAAASANATHCVERNRRSRPARSFARPCLGLSFLQPCRHAPRPTAGRRGRGMDAHGGDSAAGCCERQRGRAAVRFEVPRPVPGRGRRHPRPVHQAGRAPLPAPPRPAGRRRCRPADATRARAARPPGAGQPGDAPGNARLGRGRPPVPALAPRPFARRRRRRLRPAAPAAACAPSSVHAGLGVDGLAGPATLAALRRRRSASPIPAPAPVGPVSFFRPVPAPIGDRLRRPTRAAGAAIRASTSRPTPARASRRPAWGPPSLRGATTAATATSW